MGRWMIEYINVGEAEVCKVSFPDADCLIDVENEALCEVRRICNNDKVMLNYVSSRVYVAISGFNSVGMVTIKSVT